MKSHTPLSFFLSFLLSICLSFHLSFCLSIFLSVFPSFFLLYKKSMENHVGNCRGNCMGNCMGFYISHLRIQPYVTHFYLFFSLSPFLNQFFATFLVLYSRYTNEQFCMVIYIIMENSYFMQL